MGFLAALVPIITSIYAACSFIHEQVELEHEERVRYRVEGHVSARAETLDAEGVPSYSDEGQQHLRAFRDRMLGYNGIETRVVTFRDFNILTSMSGNRVSTRELTRQWLLIIGSIAGVVFLSLDTASSRL